MLLEAVVTALPLTLSLDISLSQCWASWAVQADVYKSQRGELDASPRASLVSSG